MKQEDIKLLLKDLCARLPYEVIVNIEYSKEHGSSYRLRVCSEGDLKLNTDLLGLFIQEEIYLKPYLRPMSSMTEEEEMELTKITSQLTFDRRYNLLYVGRADDGGCDLSEMEKIVDYLISHHFDFRGLISLGLALEALKGMYGI